MKKINWRYAIGEVFLIFIGITLAIAFQNWNEKRKQNELETAVLQQLKIALNNDLGDVNANIATHQRAMSSCQSIFQSLKSSAPIDDQKLIIEINNAVDYTFLVSDVSSYEYLKSVGLHIIRTDSLRNQITQLYDVVYESIYGVENNARPVQEDVIDDMKKYYTGSDQFFVPIGNTNTIKNDKAFKFDLKKLEFSHQLMIRRYQNKIKPELEKLIRMVNLELQKS